MKYLYRALELEQREDLYRRYIATISKTPPEKRKELMKKLDEMDRVIRLLRIEVSTLLYLEKCSSVKN